MTLPRITSTIYTLTIPSIKKEVKFRPFTVKEQKALLVAQQSEDPKIMADTLKGIIKACVLDKLDVDSLATFDVEFIFLQIRAKSVGEIAELIFTCSSCKAKTNFSFDITEIEVVFQEGHNNKIDLGDGIGVILKYPTLDTLKNIDAINSNDVAEAFELIISCIDQIYDDQQVYHAKEYSKEELTEFVEGLSTSQFADIQKFFTTLPRLEKVLDFVCPKCGEKQKSTLKGLSDFF